jgi:hypothetical protein
MAFTIASNVAVRAAAAPGRRVAPKRNVAARAGPKAFEMPDSYKKVCFTCRSSIRARESRRYHLRDETEDTSRLGRPL